MKRFILLLAILCGLAPLITSKTAPPPPAVPQAAPAKQPTKVTLAAEAKFGPVTFNHEEHAAGKRNIAGTGPIECVECHHTAQPAAEVQKRVPLKTAYPADRTTTLTSELVEKNPETAGVAVCRDCHARAGEKPKLLDAIPQIKHEASTAEITLTNQQAFHRECARCHDEVLKSRPDAKAPATLKCAGCHKKNG
jgi:cytochrome c553